jgi:putative chitobiose transport system permease protein
VWVGLRNFEQLAQDPIFRDALVHSFIYLLVTPTLIILSIILAIIVNRPLPGINAFRALYYIPVISGSIAVGYSWRMLFDTNGLINGALQTLGILQDPIQWLAEPSFTLPIAMLLTIWLGLGYYMMIFLAGLQNIPEELYDAALIDGCNGVQKHWYVSLPGLRPQITFVAVVSSLAALEVFNEIYTLTGDLGGILNSGVTVVFYLWRQAFRLQHAGYASAVALVLLVITLAFSVINIRSLERGTEAD